jgi:histidinol-phosphate aminotransferase
MSILPLIRPDLHTFSPYRSARDEAKQGKIWLNANESPWDYSGAGWNRYPEKQPAFLIEKIAAIYGVQLDQLVLLRGSDEGIDLLTRLFCRAGQDAVMICPPTFGMYAVCAQLQGVQLIEVPLRKENNFSLDIEAIYKAWTPAVKLIHLCSPNNPTANTIPEADILQLCVDFAGKSMIVVDEAYVEFASQGSMAVHIHAHPHLAILRTFSKAYGLAGVRLGAVLGSAELIHWIQAILPPYPLASPTIAALKEICTDAYVEEVQRNVAQIQAQRSFLIHALQASPLVQTVWPSEANFILIAVKEPTTLMQRYRDQGIVLRDMHGKLHLENCIRISVGTAEENAALVEVLEN